uniref:Aurora kinase n=1 Tax=Panagrolaimus sp. JU765 TaxID=591449 RepID=A0AC34PVY4_9BILA
MIPASVRKQWVTEDFQIGSTLGRGRFGTVYLAKEIETGVKVALKTLQMEEVEKMKLVRQLMREVEIHHHLNHPNIVKMFGYFVENNMVFLVLENGDGGSLFTLLKRVRAFSPHRSAYVVDRIADALAYCHERSVIHRDIKPENILLVGGFNPKLADFGWCVHAPGGDMRNTLCGTTEYLAPEMAFNAVETNTHGHKIDCWAMGILLFELLVGETPFKNVDPQAVLLNITKTNLNVNGKFAQLPEGAKSAILEVIKYEPTERAEMVDWRKNPWIREEAAKFSQKVKQ